MKTGYLVSKIPGWTPGTKSGAPVGVLGIGEMVRADDIPDVVVSSVKDGTPPYAEFADYAEYDADAPEALAARRDPSAKSNPTAPTAAGQGVRAETFGGNKGADGKGENDGQGGGEQPYTPVGKNVAEVLEYLKSVDDENEVNRVKELEASSDRKSSQIANYEASGS